MKINLMLRDCTLLFYTQQTPFLLLIIRIVYNTQIKVIVVVQNEEC